jgi:transposase
MFGRERRVLLKDYLDQGLSKTAIAEQLGIGRRTVYHWLATGQLERDLDAEVRYRPRPPVPTKLDPYKPLIETRLAEFPELTATRLFDEVRAAGYRGSLTQLKLFVRRVRPQPPPEPVRRFETPPGKQAQVDFARFRLPWGVRYALLVVLGYSRLLWLRFYPRQDMPTLFAGLEAAFSAFGGVPAELLFDQMRAVVVRDLRLDGRSLTTNAECRRFAAHWDFQIRACRPYRAKTKGKVERPIRYLRQSFFYGRSFVSDADLNAQAERWLTSVANQRLHQTTHARPQERFEREEQPLLQPLAPRPYQSLILAADFRRGPTPLVAAPVQVEQRPLTVYAELAGGRA